MKSIFTVTCLSITNGIYEGAGRCFGFFFCEKDAMEAVQTNRCDIQERTYDYCVIEEYGQGIHNIPNETQWFKHNEELYQETDGHGGWEKCEKPSELSLIAGFGIG